jgi:hypothetical protein
MSGARGLWSKCTMVKLHCATAPFVHWRTGLPRSHHLSDFCQCPSHLPSFRQVVFWLALTLPCGSFGFGAPIFLKQIHQQKVGITQLFNTNNQTVWQHLKGTIAVQMTLHKVGFKFATVHLSALCHSPPHCDCLSPAMDQVNNYMIQLCST